MIIVIVIAMDRERQTDRQTHIHTERLFVTPCAVWSLLFHFQMLCDGVSMAELPNAIGQRRRA